MELISHADMARLHPTGDHPESAERLKVLQAAFEWREGAARDGGGDRALPQPRRSSR